MSKVKILSVVVAGVLVIAVVLSYMNGNKPESTDATDCGKVQIADMNWPSAEFFAYLDKFMLEKGMGCQVELVPGDTVPTGTSMMEKGRPDVAPELWVNAIKVPLEKAVKEGRLEYAGTPLGHGGEEGLWVPQYMVDKNPELATIKGLLKHPELFPNSGDKSKGLLMGCPSGWSCQIVMTNLFNAFGFKKAGFVLGDPGSSASLDASLSKAYEREQGWLGYYWSPTVLLSKYKMVKVDWGVPYSKTEWERCTSIVDCVDPKPNGWPSPEVWTVTTTQLKNKAPKVQAYFSKRTLPNALVTDLLKWMYENQAEGDEVAAYFLKKNEKIWSSWVSKEEAKKIKAAL